MKTFFYLTVFCLAATSVAKTEKTVAPKQSIGACQADAEKLCSGFGEDGLLRCLSDHHTELSSTCQANMKAPVDRKPSNKAAKPATP